MNEAGRRKFLMASGALALPFAARAVLSGRKYRLGILLHASPLAAGLRTAPWPVVIERLRALGYIEGQNLQIDMRSAEGRLERMPELAAELTRLMPDALAAIGNPPALALHSATSSTPIVGVFHAAVGVGLISSLARPGGNVTGIDTLAPELDAKRMQLLQELVPNAKRIVAIYNPGNDPGMLIHFRQLGDAALKVGIAVRPIEIRRLEDADAVFAGLKRDAPDALFVITDSLIGQLAVRIASFALEQRLPSMFEFSEFAEGGGLMSYGPASSDLARHMAEYLQRIFEGTLPADLPVEHPTSFELVLNRKSAQKIGVSIPQSTLVRADRVIG